MAILVPISKEYQPLFKKFKCNLPKMDAFLREQALYYNELGEGKTFLLIHDNQVIGYFTLKCSAIQIFDKEMTEEPREFPAIEISRLAVNYRYQKQGYGEKILAHALTTILDIKSNYCGVRFVTLFSVPDAVGFYEHTFEFEEAGEDVEIVYCEDSNKGCTYMYKYL